MSFQRDEIDLDNSKFIIIIGPNWSGKTSIFQAIKFALGSNERDERYKKWADFIRNGQDHAMVELHIIYNNELIKIRRLVIKSQSPFFEIKRKCPDIIICATTSGRVHPQVEHRAEVLDLNPEMASLTMGSLNFPLRTKQVQNQYREREQNQQQ